MEAVRVEAILLISSGITFIVLHQDPYSIRYYKRAKLQRTSHIFLSEDKNYYSVPFRYTGMYVEVQYNQDIVEILYNHVRIASHERSYRRSNYKTIAEHMPSTHQAYGQWSPEYFEQRATQVGPGAQKYIQMLLNQSRYPEIAYKQSLGILSFVRLYSSERLEKACMRASTYHKASFHTVSNILKNRLDMVEEEEEEKLFQYLNTVI